MSDRCVYCNEPLSLDAHAAEARCPKCQKLQPASGTKGPPPALKIALAVLALLVGGGGGWLAYSKAHKQHPPGQVPLEPIDAESARIDVRTLTELDPGPLAQLLEANDQVAAFAQRAAAGKSGDAAQAQAICDALKARKSKRAFVEWSRVDARMGGPLTAAETLSALAEDSAERQLYPLELSALAVASLRSLGVPAMIAEVYRYPNERVPVDPSGRFGYFAALIPAHAGKPTHVYDAYGGRTSQPLPVDYVVLNDAQAIGAALAIRAIDRLNNSFDPDGALLDSAAALKLLPNSPSAHTARAGVVLTRADGGTDGTEELEIAAKLRPDAARHANLGTRALAQGAIIPATQELRKALDETPDYAQAVLMQAAAFMMIPESALAHQRLEDAEKLDPTLGQLPQLWAQWYSNAGVPLEALRYAREAVKRRPNDPQPLFVLARIELKLGYEEEVHKHARDILERVPPADRERRSAMLLGAFGPTALDPPAKREAWLRDAGVQPTAAPTKP
jgi:tetratricopeptide (TPR) repeat protein